MKTNVKLVLLSILVVSVFLTGRAVAQRQEIEEFQVEVQIVEAEFDSLFPAETASRP